MKRRLFALLAAAATVLGSMPLPAAAHYITPAGYRVEWTGAGQTVRVYDQTGALAYEGAAQMNAGGRLVPPSPYGDGAPEYYYFDRPDPDTPTEKITGYWGEVPILRDGQFVGWGLPGRSIMTACGSYRVRRPGWPPTAGSIPGPARTTRRA